MNILNFIIKIINIVFFKLFLNINSSIFILKIKKLVKITFFTRF